jgi:hypothetical protein
MKKTGHGKKFPDMKISEAIQQSITNNSHINAYGCYLLAKEIEKDNDRYIHNSQK